MFFSPGGVPSSGKASCECPAPAFSKHFLCKLNWVKSSLTYRLSRSNRKINFNYLLQLFLQNPVSKRHCARPSYPRRRAPHSTRPPQKAYPRRCRKMDLQEPKRRSTEGDHLKGARMLIRVANNISKFPSRKLCSRMKYMQGLRACVLWD